MAGALADTEVQVSAHDEESPRERRDLNLSDVVRHIRDDGPAAVDTEMAESAAGASQSEEAPSRPMSAVSDSPPQILVEPLSGGAARTSGRRGIAVAASAAVVVVLMGLALFFAGAGVSILPSTLWERTAPDNLADQRSAREAAVSEVPPATAAVAREDNERVRQRKALVAEGDQVDKARIARLEERVQQAQATLAALAHRLELVARPKDESSVGPDTAKPVAHEAAADGSPSRHSAAVQQPQKGGPTRESAAAAPQPDGLTSAVQTIAAQGETRIAQALAKSADSASSLDRPKPKERTHPEPAAHELQTAAAKVMGLAVPKQDASGTGEALGTAGLAPREAPSALQRKTAVPPEPSWYSPPAKASTQASANPGGHATASGAKQARSSPASRPVDAPPEKAGRGTWAINLVAVSTRERAEAAQRVYREKGLRTEIVVLRRHRSRATLFGVGIPGFGTKEDAFAQVPAVKAKLGIKTVWVHPEE